MGSQEFDGEPVDAPLIEHTCMPLAATAEIHVTTTMPLRLAGQHAVAIRRFDRVGTAREHCNSKGAALRAIAPGAIPSN